MELFKQTQTLDKLHIDRGRYGISDGAEDIHSTCASASTQREVCMREVIFITVQRVPKTLHGLLTTSTLYFMPLINHALKYSKNMDF